MKNKQRKQYPNIDTSNNIITHIIGSFDQIFSKCGNPEVY